MPGQFLCRNCPDIFLNREPRAENHEQRTRQFKKVLKNERPFGFSALCGMNLFGYIELRFSMPPDGDWLGALKPPF